MAQLDLVVEGTLCKQVYPKTAIAEPGTFAIFSVVISRIVQGTIDPRTITKWNGDNEITFKGSVPELRFGTTYRIGAKLVEDPKYGFGYQIAVMNVCADFDSEEGIRRFLSYVLTEKQISALMEAFENPIPVFEAHDVEALCKIKGIKYATAEKILDKYERSKDNSEAYAELYDFGLTKHMIDKLVAQYKSCQTLIERVRGNPYILIDEVDGIGWQKADNMALKSGIGYDSVFRVSAYIKYYLKNLAETDGHTWVPLETLVANVRGLVKDINKEFLQKILRDMLDEKQLYYDREHRRIGLMRYRVLEENIYQDLVRLRDAETATGLKYIDETIAECEQVVGFEYTDEQKTAIKQICCSNVCLLTALAGSGKSSLMYPVTRIFRKNNVEFAQCTLSGKASLNLTELTTEVGQTIHRLLAYDPVTDRFMYNRKSQLPFEAIILDEVSMVGGELFYSLIQSIQTGGRLIMIGDPGQLESIGLCNLISDLVNSRTIEHACLTQIFRQAEASGIITDSIKVYHQQPILPKGFVGSVTHGELEDFDIDVVDDAEICAAKAIESYHNIRFGMNVPAEDIVVVTAKRSLGILSAASLNQRIQSMFTFYGETMTREYTDGNCKYSVCYHIGDRVIVTKNNYQAVDVSGEIQPIYNGNIGTVTDIQSKDGVIIVKLPQGYIKLGRSDLASLQLGYAITCAKSQGSGFKYVISVCDPSVPIMLTKEFLYTAITRAKKKCHLIGTSFSINKCIQTTRVIAKQTWLLGLLSGDDQVQCH